MKQGCFFSAWNLLYNEKRFYDIDIEYSRKKSREYPARRLPISRIDEIINLDPNLLNKHFVFADGEPFFTRCNEISQPFITSSGPWQHLKEFTGKYYEYYKSRFCNTFRSPIDSLITYDEIPVGDNTLSGYQALINVTIENRRKLLASQQEILMNRTAVEQEKAQGKLQQLLQFLPLATCVDVAQDMIFTNEDTSHSSTMISLFEAITCAADLYTAYGVRKTLTILISSLRLKYAAYYVRKSTLKKFNEELVKTASSSRGYSQPLLSKISDENEKIRLLDLEIADLKQNIYKSMGDLVSVPVFTAFPYLSFRSGEEFMFASIPWGINLVRMYTKTNVRAFRSQDIQVPWSNPQADTLLVEEMYPVKNYTSDRISCYDPFTPPTNMTLDIFDLRSADPLLYQQLFVAALHNPYPRAIIAAAGEGGWVIPSSYNQMAMFCFISLTTLVRHYTGIILALEDYYKTGRNDIKITESALYQYYSDFQSRPGIPLPVILKPVQVELVDQAIIANRALLDSNLQGVEINYLFMIVWLLMSGDVAGVLQEIYRHPQDKRRLLERVQLELSWNLERLTIYATRHSLTQKNFLDAVVEKFYSWARELTEYNPGQMALFSPTVETFLQRRENYHPPADGELLPSPASFVTNWLRVTKDLTETYHTFARIEYSAKVLADYPAAQWPSEAALLAWNAALQHYLAPEMHYEDLAPFLLNATRRLSESWLQRERTAGSTLKIIENNVVNQQFISDVQQALKGACAAYPTLFFSRFYQIDNGYWFTFLTNDFITNTHQRSRRQVFTPHPAWPLAPLTRPSPRESVISPFRQRLAVWKPDQHFDNALLYQQLLKSVPASFAQYSSRPFHERLYGHLLEDFPQPDPSAASPGATLINSVIDEHGELIDYQLRILSRYLPQLSGADNYPLLQILSDIFQLSHPQAPRLYQFIFRRLQARLAQPQLRLLAICQQSFLTAQISEIYQHYLPEIKQADDATRQALQRFIAATLRHLLAFTLYLTDIEPLLATAPLFTLPAQWLCLGAIITRQSGIPLASTEELLQLAQAALGDAGLLSLSDTAIQQTALLVSPLSESNQRQPVDGALKVIASAIQQAALMQQQVLAVVENNQQLHALLGQLSFDDLSAERGRQLTDLTASALERQRQLLQGALLQLSAHQGLNLAQALKKQKLRISWYPASDNNHSQKVAALAFHLPDRQGVLLPLGDPLNMPLIFRQLPQSAADRKLSLLSFGIAGLNHTLSAPVEISLPAQQPGDAPLSVMAALMHAEATTRISTLMSAKHNQTFIQAKQQLESWMESRLFFFNSDDDDAIQQQAEYLTLVSENPTLLSWQQPDYHAPANTSAVNWFSRAITDAMGAHTAWPGLTDGLRTIRQRVGPVTLESLPPSAFVGFWWDPASSFCYLGWGSGDQRTLYASVAEDRQRLYPLRNDSASAGIWQELVIFDWLKHSLQALHQGSLSHEKFFSYSLPFAWQLRCAMAGATPLPPGTLPEPGGNGLYTLGSGSARRYFFAPQDTQQALPVSFIEQPEGGYQLEFIPAVHSVSRDLAFRLHISQAGSLRPDEGKITAPSQWRLVSADHAARLIAEGNFSPVSYLQWTASAPGASMTPLVRVLQRTDGSIVFIFGENNWRRISYRVPDAEGVLRPSPCIPADWPREINAVNLQQLIAAVDRFFLQQNTAGYWPFPQDDDQLNAAKELSAIRLQTRSAINAAATAMRAIPFRFAEHAEIDDELFHINIHFHRQDQHFYDEVKKHAGMEDSAITLGDLRWKLLDWRQADFSQQAIFAQALEHIAQQKRLLESMLELLTQDHTIQYRSLVMRQWIQHSLDTLEHASTAMAYIQQQPTAVKSPDSDELWANLQQQRFAQNYFFGYYNQQLHASADFFQQPWQCVRDNGGIAVQRWQNALDLLLNLTQWLPASMRELDRLLTLPEVLWQTPEMQQHAQQWQQLCHNASRYWQKPHRAEQMILLRPKASEQGLDYIPQKYHWPVRLMLAAGIGNLDEGTAAPLQINLEQHHDLLLTLSAPDAFNVADARLGGIGLHPQDARGFAALARLRLSSPWALAQFSTAAFLARLQQRIQQAMEQESAHWSAEERDFYHSADTGRFLQEELEEKIASQQYLQFFGQLFNSNLLVTRLIMPDVEMVFGFLCDGLVEHDPGRASEDLSAAWFLFLQTFEHHGEGDLWLVGV